MGYLSKRDVLPPKRQWVNKKLLHVLLSSHKTITELRGYGRRHSTREPATNTTQDEKLIPAAPIRPPCQRFHKTSTSSNCNPQTSLNFDPHLSEVPRKKLLIWRPKRVVSSRDSILAICIASGFFVSAMFMLWFPESIPSNHDDS